MTDTITHDVLIIGSGIAGLRAAIEATRISNGKLSVGVISKVHAMRSHSVCAQGGTGAVLHSDRGDSLEGHIFDTIKGSDYLADQDAVERLASIAPQEIYQLEHLGMPWSREVTDASRNERSADTVIPGRPSPVIEWDSMRCKPSTTHASATPTSSFTMNGS